MGTIAVTGHRPHRLGKDYKYTSPLVMAIREDMKRIMIDQGCTLAISGMALGIDTVFALLALELGIPLICAVPFAGQESLWPPKQRDQYRRILAKAFDVVILSDIDIEETPAHINELYDERNKWMVDQLVPPDDRLLAVLDGKPGGTKNCYTYAKKQLGEEYIIRLNPVDYFSIISPQGKLF